MASTQPTVLTACQEKEQRFGTGFGAHWNGKGTHMWRLKQEKPHLFEQSGTDMQVRVVGPIDATPTGFEPCDMPGWLYNKQTKVYWQKATKQRFWFDEVARVHRPLREGDTCPVTFLGGSAAVPCKDTPPVDSEKAASAKPHSVIKHVLISDLHRASKALKVDLNHLDSPASALVLIGASGPSSASSSAAPSSASAQQVQSDAAARLLPEKLLRRLAAFRGEWSKEMLCGAISGALDDVTAGLSGCRPVASLALTIGHHVIVGATPGGRFSVGLHSSGHSEPPTLELMAAPSHGEPTVTMGMLLNQSTADALIAVLTTGEIGVDDAKSLTVALPHLSSGRPRAASISLLQAARGTGASGGMAAACMWLGPLAVSRRGGEAALGEAASSSAPPAKRQKTEEAPKKVRLRQILLRHASGLRPTDPVRRKPVTRTAEEAEMQMLGVLGNLTADGCASFASTCKAVSECQSALKGREFAGDLGWLDRSAIDGVQKDREKALRGQMPTNVLRAGFELLVGELGDLVASDIGVHILQRTA